MLLEKAADAKGVTKSDKQHFYPAIPTICNPSEDHNNQKPPVLRQLKQVLRATPMRMVIYGVMGYSYSRPAGEISVNAIVQHPSEGLTTKLMSVTYPQIVALPESKK